VARAVKAKLEAAAKAGWLLVQKRKDDQLFLV
jgi:hypothetical protein